MTNREIIEHIFNTHPRKESALFAALVRALDEKDAALEQLRKEKDEEIKNVAMEAMRMAQDLESERASSLTKQRAAEDAAKRLVEAAEDLWASWVQRMGTTGDQFRKLQEALALHRSASDKPEKKLPTLDELQGFMKESAGDTRIAPIDERNSGKGERE